MCREDNTSTSTTEKKASSSSSSSPTSMFPSSNKDSGEEEILVGQPSWLSTESYASTLLIFSAILYSFMASFVHLVTGISDVTSTEVVFVRAVFQGFFVIIAMCFFKTDGQGGEDDDEKITRPVLLIQQPFGTSDVRSVVIARGMVGGLGFMFYYYTMSILRVGDATTLLSLTPILTVAAGVLFLSEPAKLTHWLAVIASLIGSLLLAQPSFLFPSDDEDSSTTATTTTVDSNNFFGLSGYVTGPLGSCCGAAVLILVRRAGKIGVHTLQLLFSWCCFGLFYSLLIGVIGPILFGNGSTTFVMPPNFITWMYLLGNCITGSLAHLLMNYGAQHTPAGISSIIRSSTIMWSFILEVIIFNEIPVGTTLMGVALIVISLIAVALEKIQQQQNGQPKDDDSNRDVDQINNSNSKLLFLQKRNQYGSTTTSSSVESEETMPLNIPLGS